MQKSNNLLNILKEDLASKVNKENGFSWVEGIINGKKITVIAQFIGINSPARRNNHLRYSYSVDGKSIPNSKILTAIGVSEHA